MMGRDRSLCLLLTSFRCTPVLMQTAGRLAHRRLILLIRVRQHSLGTAPAQKLQCGHCKITNTLLLPLSPPPQGRPMPHRVRCPRRLLHGAAKGTETVLQTVHQRAQATIEQSHLCPLYRRRWTIHTLHMASRPFNQQTRLSVTTQTHRDFIIPIPRMLRWSRSMKVRNECRPRMRPTRLVMAMSLPAPQATKMCQRHHRARTQPIKRRISVGTGNVIRACLLSMWRATTHKHQRRRTLRSKLRHTSLNKVLWKVWRPLWRGVEQGTVHLLRHIRHR